MDKKLRILAIISGSLLIISLILGLIIIINPSSGNGEYGNRLSGIENVRIEDNVITKIKEELTSKDKVESVTYYLQGKLMKFTVKFSSNVDTSKLDEYTKIITNNLKEEELKFYDIQVIFECEEGNYPVYASRHKTSTTFSYSIMKKGEKDE